MSDRNWQQYTDTAADRSCNYLAAPPFAQQRLDEGQLSTGSTMEMQDNYYRGFGRLRGRPMPQRAPTDEQAERFRVTWADRMEALRNEIETHDDEAAEAERLRLSLAALQPTDEVMAAVITSMRARYYGPGCAVPVHAFVRRR